MNTNLSSRLKAKPKLIDPMIKNPLQLYVEIKSLMEFVVVFSIHLFFPFYVKF